MDEGRWLKSGFRPRRERERAREREREKGRGRVSAAMKEKR